MKLLVVDDHHLIREGLKPVLRRLGDGEEAQVMEAPGFEDALRIADENPDLDLVVLDFHLPGVAGFAALNDLQDRHPGLPIVVMSGADDPAIMREAIDRGALGFIPKSSGSEVILNALRLVLSGGTYLPREVMSAPRATVAPAPAPRTGRLKDTGLTPRQIEVLELLVAGAPNKAICRALNLSEGTVKTHIQAIFKALDVTSRVQAVNAVNRLIQKD